MNYEYLQDSFYSLFPICKDVKFKISCNFEECPELDEEYTPHAVPIHCEVAIPIDYDYYEIITI
jgi:hypothetical protein|tara:strand:- start:1143 stop:1334 length:192 start_codon:yes stop_codon:yes gene_type:complete